MATEEENTTNLIINYLPQSLTDAKFREMFEEIGPLKSSKICREKSTNYSYGFGFADYKNPEDAQRAIEQLSGKEIENKRIKVALSRPGGHSIKGANLYVSSLPKDFDESDIENLFKDCGKIIHVSLLREPSGDSRRVAFVLFNKKYEADKAIDIIDNTIPQGGSEPIRVKFKNENSTAMQKNKSFMPAMPARNFRMQQPQSMQSLMNISTNMPSMQQQQSMMQNNFGGPMRNDMSARFRYNPMAAAPNVNQHFSPNFYCDTLDQDYCMDSLEQAPGDFCVFVHNVGNDCQQSELYRLFAPFGALQKVDIVMDKERDQCKGFAFVHFVNYSDAVCAIKELNGSPYKGNQLQVRFKK